jgi:hypothetical protein
MACVCRCVFLQAAVELDKSYVKGYVRVGRAALALGLVDVARPAFSQVCVGAIVPHPITHPCM